MNRLADFLLSFAANWPVAEGHLLCICLPCSASAAPSHLLDLSLNVISSGLLITPSQVFAHVVLYDISSKQL